MFASAATRRRNCIFSLSVLLVLIGNVSCLALRVDTLSATGQPPPPPSALIHSIRQKGGITQRISWNEHDYYNHQKLPSTPSTAVSQPLASAISDKLRHIFQFRSLLSSLRSTFLPVSYPHQVPSGYLRYAIWSWTQDWSTQLRSVLATQRVLQGVGVGRSDATTLAALYNFMLRDGCGMLATLLFTAVASSNFGTNLKPWRLFADIMVDVGITLEVLATGAPKAWFLPMICVGNMCKAMCGVAAGACSGAINLHWATPPTSIVVTSSSDMNGDGTSSNPIVVQAPPPNIADIQAKFNAQHTVTASLGLVMAAWFAKSVSNLQNSWQLGILYTALTVLHLFANIQCLRCLALTSFNPTRFAMVTDHFMEWWLSPQLLPPPPADITAETLSDTAVPSLQPQLPSLPTPTDIAKTEPLFFFQRQQRRFSNLLRWKHGLVSSGDRPRIRMGVSFPEWWQIVAQPEEPLSPPSLAPDALTVPTNNTIASTATDAVAALFTKQDVLQQAKSQLAQQNYLLAVGQGKTPTIAIAFGKNVTARQMAKAYLEAHVLWSRRIPPAQSVKGQSVRLSYDKVLEWEQSEEWQHLWNVFQQSCAQSGWNLDATQMPTRGYQIDWQ